MDLTGLGSAFDFASGLLDRFFPKEMSEAERAQVAQAMTAEIASRDAAKGQIIVSEMSQGDLYTKRARPTVVYGGLLMIAVNHVIFPLTGRVAALMSEHPEAVEKLIQPISLPEEFWWAWGGIVSTWVLGRSAEKRGNTDKLTKLINGVKG